VRLLTTEPCFHGWYYRWKMSCYTRAGFETPEMLNQHNCYFCHPPEKCPGTDPSDGFFFIRSPLEYEAVLTLSDGDFTMPEKPTAAELREGFAPQYAAWKQRVDAYTAQVATAAAAAAGEPEDAGEGHGGRQPEATA
jgi:hypothetical protein